MVLASLMDSSDAIRYQDNAQAIAEIEKAQASP
jgi:hypothetical protein